MIQTIPPGYLLLEEAFEQLLSAYARADEFSQVCSEEAEARASRVTRQATATEDSLRERLYLGFSEDPRMIDEDLNALEAVERIMRDALMGGDLRAYIVDETGQVVELADRSAWQGKRGIPLSLGMSSVPDQWTSPGPDTGGRPVFIKADAFAKWLESWLPSTSNGAQPKMRRGPKLKYDRDRVRSEVFKLMDYHGEFLPEDKEWDSQACLEREVREKTGIQAAESTLRTYVAKALKDWRNKKADNSRK